MRQRLSQNKVNREDLKEILRTNIELYREEPDFYDYITTLVVYLMKYEFEDDDPAGSHPSASAGNPDSKLPRAVGSPRDSDSLPRPGDLNIVGPPSKLIPTRFTPREGYCPHCNNKVPTGKTICPFCMALMRF
jgi:hypothetical protein